MYTLEVAVKVLQGGLNSLEDYYEFDKSISPPETWHNFGVFCQNRIAEGTMRDLKKESFSVETQTYTANLYFTTEADAISAQNDVATSNFWSSTIDSTEEKIQVTETIKSVSPLQTAGAVSLSDWFENPALDVNSQ